MGKRLTCPQCKASHDYDVPISEVTAPLREVRCRACGHRFSYGFAAEYVTESEPLEAPRSDAPYDHSADTTLARDRLARYVARYPEYADRDRDLLLLYLIDATDRLDQELAAIRRTLDVIVKRLPAGALPKSS